MSMRSASSLSFVIGCFVVCGIAGSALAAPGKACSLMTQQAAAAVYGAPVQAGVEDPHGTATTNCVFNGTGHLSVGTIDLKVMGIPPAMYGSMFQPAPGYTNTPISGLGDRAIFSTMPAPADSALWILARDKILVLDAAGSNNPNIKAALIGAAKQIVGKL
jgi:hypothetical protein